MNFHHVPPNPPPAAPPAPPPPGQTGHPTWNPGTPRAVILLWEWQYDKATHFSAKLFELFGKADSENFRKLAGAFPEHAAAWSQWRDSASRFWKQHAAPGWRFDE